MSCLGTTDERADQEKVKYLEIPILYLSITSITVAQERKTMFMIELYSQCVSGVNSEMINIKQDDGITQSCLMHRLHLQCTGY